MYVELNKDGPSIVDPIREATDGGCLPHPIGGVGKWVTPPNMGGKPCSLRDFHCDGGLTMVEYFRSNEGRLRCKENMKIYVNPNRLMKKMLNICNIFENMHDGCKGVKINLCGLL